MKNNTLLKFCCLKAFEFCLRSHFFTSGLVTWIVINAQLNDYLNSKVKHDCSYHSHITIKAIANDPFTITKRLHEFISFHMTLSYTCLKLLWCNRSGKTASKPSKNSTMVKLCCFNSNVLIFLTQSLLQVDKWLGLL